MSFDSTQLAASRLRLLDYSKLLQPTPILDRHLLPLSQADRRKAVSMLTQSKLQENVSSKLLQLMLHRGYKAETEALNSMAGGMARQVSCLLANEVDFQP